VVEWWEECESSVWWEEYGSSVATCCTCDQEDSLGHFMSAIRTRCSRSRRVWAEVLRVDLVQRVADVRRLVPVASTMCELQWW
jgi:hypothetical protein